MWRLLAAFTRRGATYFLFASRQRVAIIIENRDPFFAFFMSDLTARERLIQKILGLPGPAIAEVERVISRLGLDGVADEFARANDGETSAAPLVVGPRDWPHAPLHRLSDHAAWFERTATPAQVRTIYGFPSSKVKVPDEFDPVAPE